MCDVLVKKDEHCIQENLHKLHNQYIYLVNQRFTFFAISLRENVFEGTHRCPNLQSHQIMNGILLHRQSVISHSLENQTQRIPCVCDVLPAWQTHVSQLDDSLQPPMFQQIQTHH